jgi:hypothetical protein
MNLQILQSTLSTQARVLSTSQKIQSAVSNTIAMVVNDEENEDEDRLVHGGSRPGRRANLPRDFKSGYQQLYKDYLSPEPVYPDYLFRCHF